MQTIMLEEEYGYRYYLWLFHGKIRELVKEWNRGETLPFSHLFLLQEPCFLGFRDKYARKNPVKMPGAGDIRTSFSIERGRKQVVIPISVDRYLSTMEMIKRNNLFFLYCHFHEEDDTFLCVGDKTYQYPRHQ